MGIDSTVGRKWSNSFSCKLVSSILISIHKATLLLITIPVIGSLGLITFPESVAWFIAGIQLYFEHRTRLEHSWIGLKGFWFFNILVEIFSIIYCSINYTKKTSQLIIIYKSISLFFNSILFFFSYDYTFKSKFSKRFLENTNEEGSFTNIEPEDLSLILIEISEIKNRKFNLNQTNDQNSELSKISFNTKLIVSFKNKDDEKNITFNTDTYNKKAISNVENFDDYEKNTQSKFDSKIESLKEDLVEKSEKIYEIICKKSLDNFIEFNNTILKEYKLNNESISELNPVIYLLDELNSNIVKTTKNFKNEMGKSINIKDIVDFNSLKQLYFFLFKKNCVGFKKLLFEFMNITDSSTHIINKNRLSEDEFEVQNSGANSNKDSTKKYEAQSMNTILENNSYFSNGGICQEFSMQLYILNKLLIFKNSCVFKVNEFNQNNNQLYFTIKFDKLSYSDKLNIIDIKNFGHQNKGKKYKKITRIINNYESTKILNENCSEILIKKLEKAINLVINDGFYFSRPLVIFFSIHKLLDVNIQNDQFNFFNTLLLFYFIFSKKNLISNLKSNFYLESVKEISQSEKEIIFLEFIQSEKLLNVSTNKYYIIFSYKGTCIAKSESTWEFKINLDNLCSIFEEIDELIVNLINSPANSQYKSPLRLNKILNEVLSNCRNIISKIISNCKSILSEYDCISEKNEDSKIESDLNGNYLNNDSLNTSKVASDSNKLVGNSLLVKKLSNATTSLKLNKKISINEFKTNNWSKVKELIKNLTHSLSQIFNTPTYSFLLFNYELKESLNLDEFYSNKLLNSNTLNQSLSVVGKNNLLKRISNEDYVNENQNLVLISTYSKQKKEESNLNIDYKNEGGSLDSNSYSSGEDKKKDSCMDEFDMKFSNKSQASMIEDLLKK